MPEYLPVQFTAYEDSTDLDVDMSGKDPVVTNHDEVATYQEIRAMSSDDVTEYALDSVSMDHPAIPDDWTIKDLKDNGPVRVN